MLASILAGLALLEIGARVLRRARGEAWDPAAVRASIQRARAQGRSFAPRAATSWFENPAEDPATAFHLHPFLAWGVGQGEALLDAELALRREPGAGDAFDVLILGGSVAAVFSLEEQGLGRLREVLAADPRLAGRELRFLGFGTGGYKQPQQVNRLVYLLAVGLVPDVVIEIDGFNEVALGNKNATVGVSPAFPSSQHWAFLAGAAASDRRGLDLASELRETQRDLEAACEGALDWRLERSCFLGGIALARVGRIQAECVEKQEACARYMTEASAAIVRGPAFQGGLDAAIGECVRVWAESSRTMQDLCRARGIQYVHVLQPTLHDEGSKPATKGEIASGGMEQAWMDGVRAGYPRLREAGARLREQGVHFLDLSRIFEGVPDEIYFDACHMGKKGNRMLAERIGAELLSNWTAR